MDTREWDKMVAGELYYAADPELIARRLRARRLAQAFCAVEPGDLPGRSAALSALLGYETDAYIEPPFFCDYGVNISLGAKVYMNFNCVVLDVAPVRIGDGTLLGPCVQLLTATHPLRAAERRGGLELAAPITLGAEVWLGGGVIVCPGVTIGDRAVVGAGSVVTRDVPADTVVVGNPARPVRQLDPDEPARPAEPPSSSR